MVFGLTLYPGGKIFIWKQGCTLVWLCLFVVGTAVFHAGAPPGGGRGGGGGECRCMQRPQACVGTLARVL